MGSRNRPGFLGMQPLCLPPPSSSRFSLSFTLAADPAGCCRARLVQEVASRTCRRRWQIRLFFRATSFFITGQRSGFGVFFCREGGAGKVMGTAEESVTKSDAILAVQKSCFRLRAADDQWCCRQIRFQLAAVSPGGQFQPKAHCSGGTARGFRLLWAKNLPLPSSTTEKKSWR